MGKFITKVLGSKPDAIAPDGSEVRLLPEMTRGGMAHFALGPHHCRERLLTRRSRRFGTSYAETVGCGAVLVVAKRLWTYSPECPSTSRRAQFQFRNDGDERLEAIGVTMPPCPGADEAFQVEGIWEPTV